MRTFDIARATLSALVNHPELLRDAVDSDAVLEKLISELLSDLSPADRRSMEASAREAVILSLKEKY